MIVGEPASRTFEEIHPVRATHPRRDDAGGRLDERRTFLFVEHYVVQPIVLELGHCLPQWILPSRWDIDRTSKVVLSALLYETSAGGDGLAVDAGHLSEDQSILARFKEVVAMYADVSNIPAASLKATWHLLRLLVYDDVDTSGVSSSSLFEHESQILEQLMSIPSKPFWEAVLRGATLLGSVGRNSFAWIATAIPSGVAVPLASDSNVCLEIALDDYIAAREKLTDTSREKAEEFLAHLSSAEKRQRFRRATGLVLRRRQRLEENRSAFPATGALPATGPLPASHLEESRISAEVYEQAMRLTWGAKWIDELSLMIDPSSPSPRMVRLSVQEEAEFVEFVLDLKARLSDEISSADDFFPSRAKLVFAVILAAVKAYGLQPRAEPGNCWWPLISTTLSRGAWKKINMALRCPVKGFRVSVKFLQLADENLAD